MLSAVPLIGVHCEYRLLGMINDHKVTTDLRQTI